MEINDDHAALVRLVTQIVQDAAMRSMLSPATDAQRVEYVKARAGEVAEIATRVAEVEAGAMANLILEGTFLKLPLRESTAGKGSPIRWPSRLSGSQTTKPVADE